MNGGRYYWESLFDPDPHPCIGCGVIIQFPTAKRCPKCRREKDRKETAVRRNDRKERGECIQCGKTPVFKAARCESHWERNREYQGEYRKRRYRKENPWKFIPCEICGRTIRKNTYMKFCRPCSIESVMQKDRSRYWDRRNLGLCKCGMEPEQGKVLCIKCRVRVLPRFHGRLS